jgi:hypothetical protein
MFLKKAKEKAKEDAAKAQLAKTKERNLASRGVISGPSEAQLALERVSIFAVGVFWSGTTSLSAVCRNVGDPLSPPPR